MLRQFQQFNFKKFSVNASKTVAKTLHDSDFIAISDIFPARVAIPKFVNLYPIATDNFVIVIPEAVPYPQFGTYIQNAFSHKLLPVNVGITVVVIILLWFIRSKVHKDCDILHTAIDVLNLMASNNDTIKYQRLSRSEIALLVPLTFVGLILTNGYMCIMLSFLIQPKMQPQIKTMEELYKSKILIFVPPVYWETEIRDIFNDQFKQKDWNGKIRDVDNIDIDRHIYSRNSSISFIALEKEAKILLKYQKRMSVRGYYIPPEGMALKKMLRMSYVNDNFPFIERANEITFWLQNAGLYRKWEDDAMCNASKTVEMDVSKNVETGDILMFSIIINGWIFSGLVFILEIIYKKCTSRMQQQKNRSHLQKM